MIRVVSLVKLTDEGARTIESFGDTVAKVRETVTGNGGTLEYAWQTGGSTISLRSSASPMWRLSFGRGTRSTSSAPSGSITSPRSPSLKHSN